MRTSLAHGRVDLAPGAGKRVRDMDDTSLRQTPYSDPGDLDVTDLPRRRRGHGPLARGAPPPLLGPPADRAARDPLFGPLPRPEEGHSAPAVSSTSFPTVFQFRLVAIRPLLTRGLASCSASLERPSPSGA